jgi:hypothetical protein
MGTLWQVQAQESEDNKTAVEEKIAEPQGLTQAALAARLALEGQAKKSPLMLLVAADMLDELKDSERSVEGVQSVTAGESGAAAGEKVPPTLEPAQLRQRALSFAASDEERQMLQQWLDRPAPRGLILEQGRNLKSLKVQDVTYKVLKAGVIKPGEKQTFTNVIFEGKKPAIVLVIGDGDGDLDLWVYDGNTDGLIGKDDDETSICRVAWTTRFEGPFRIEVANVGDIAEEYVVLVNW